MSDKYYGVYFDRSDLIVDKRGNLVNPEALYVIEFEYDESISEEPIDIRRIGKNHEVLEEYPDLSDLEYVGWDDDPCISEALDRFYEWLDEHTEWCELYPETRWQPAEYICVGIEGCC